MPGLREAALPSAVTRARGPRLELALRSSKGVVESRSEAKKALSRRINFNMRSVPISEAAAFICRLAGVHVLIDPQIYKLKGNRTVVMVQENLSIAKAVEMMTKAVVVEAGLTHSAIFLTTRGRLKELGVQPLSEQSRNLR